MANSDKRPDGLEVIMDAAAVAETIGQMAEAIVGAHDRLDEVALLGILTRGRPLAERISARIEDLSGATVPVGSLATTLYRDDLRTGKLPPSVGKAETHFDFNVDGLTVILVDDVIAAGRTVRAAMDEVMDYGRPKRIQLACLVDRQVRELPVQPDYRGRLVTPGADGPVRVRLVEIDGEDGVFIAQDNDTEEGA